MDGEAAAAVRSGTCSSRYLSFLLVDRLSHAAMAVAMAMPAPSLIGTTGTTSYKDSSAVLPSGLAA